MPILRFLQQDRRYEKIQQLGDNESVTASEKRCKRFLYSAILSCYPWMISTFILAIIVVSGIASSQTNKCTRSFSTEFEPLRELVEWKEVTFGGTLRYTELGHLYMDNGPDGIEYFGPPSPEIDRAWKDLIGGEYLIEISPEEVGIIEGKSDEHPVAGYRMIPDFIHSLHCVNHVRMILDSEHYFNASLSNLRRIDRIHIHHCLNHIRQLIECNVDLTPVTSIYMPAVDTFVGNFEQKHMCRDRGKVKAWIAARREQELKENRNGHRKVQFQEAHPGKAIPGQGYELNDDAKMPWNWTQSEYL
ncbi:hypothetical protein PT974_07672 [Cladobotryum mycophilum]|uniref:Uncharacterized protein n=1 Tax=Cladobotryum mycophilum TaxID=491253 RepID=A0ABR0SQ52_9HYPO